MATEKKTVEEDHNYRKKKSVEMSRMRTKNRNQSDRTFFPTFRRPLSSLTVQRVINYLAGMEI